MRHIARLLWRLVLNMVIIAYGIRPIVTIVSRWYMNKSAPKPEKPVVGLMYYAARVMLMWFYGTRKSVYIRSVNDACIVCRVYVTVGCPSVSPFHRSTVTARPSGLLLSAGVCSRYWSIAGTPAAGAQQQMRVASCWEPRDEAQRRLVDFVILCWASHIVSLIAGDDTFSRAAVGWWRGKKSISMIAWRVAGFAPLAHSSSPALAACKHNATLSVQMDRYGSSSCIVSRYVLRVVKSLCLKLSLCSNYSVMCILFMFRVAQKGPHFLTYIFAKCWPIFKILVRLPWAIAVNL